VIQESALPSLGERLARRIGRVAPEAVRLAKAMSVLSDGARLADAARLSDLPEAQAATIAARLQRLEVLAAAEPVEFAHPLVRRSIYELQSVTERDDAHRAAAALLIAADAGAEQAATHLAMVRPSGSVETVGVLARAAEQAVARAAPDEASFWLRRALAEQAPDPPRAQLLAQLGQVALAIRDPAATGYLQQALDEAREPWLRARAAVALAEMMMMGGRWEAGRRVLDAAREEHREGDPDVLLEIVAVDAVTSVYDPACHDRVAAEGVRWEALSQRDGWAARALAAVLATVSSIDGRDPAAVLRHAERALEGGTLLSQRSAGAWAAAQLAGSLVAVDAHARALAVCDEIEAQARGCGSLMGLMTAFGYRMWAATRRGELVAVEAELRRVLDMFAEAEIPMMFLSAVWFAMDAIVERPSLADVAASVDAAELEPEFARTWSGGMLLQVRGQLRRQRHDHRGGVADLRAGAEVAGAIAMGPLVSPWRSLLALALGADDRTEAVALVEQEIEIARRGGLARPLAVALRAAGQLDGGPRGVDRLRESLTLLENSVAQLELARTRVELGAALRRRHQRAEARDHLRVGIELARHCGADRLAERGLEELRTAGGRPRAAVWHGAESLTAGELRVARLAVAGLTNSRIAQSLFVSVKTVETHLGHVYAKLNLSGQGSRTQLAAVLGDGDELSFGGDQPSRLVDASSAAG
jgi:DNA-binding CsgD family transcriptional regulator